MIKFGTGGFRDIMNDNFNKENVRKITQAIANIIKKNKITTPVVIGYDRRFMSDIIATWVVEVLAGNNIKSKLFNKPVPTPQVMYTVKNDNLDFGITITASHNPYYYNGYKVTKKGGFDADPILTSKIEELANKNIKVKSMLFEMAKDKKLVEELDNTKDYIKHMGSFVSKTIKQNKLKVLFNTMHGVTGECISLLAKNYNLAKYEIINDESDPYFNHKLPSPAENTLEEFKKLVVKGKYSVGLACDGDGDRLGVVDELGNYYSCNTLLAIIYYYLVKYRDMKGDIVKTITTSNFLDKLAESFGFKCHSVPVGFKYVSPKMLETDALIGGEGSGGLTMRNFTPSKDSLFAISLILDTMATINKPLSKIVSEAKDFCGYISTYIENESYFINRKRLLKAIKKSPPSFSYKPTNIIYYDDGGCRYEFEDGSWIVIRFSGTENVLRYYVEFPTEIECERNIKAIKKFIEKNDK